MYSGQAQRHATRSAFAGQPSFRSFEVPGSLLGKFIVQVCALVFDGSLRDGSRGNYGHKGAQRAHTLPRLALLWL